MNQVKRVYHYQIDSEGRLWHEGSEITDPKVHKFFLRQMEQSTDGRLKVMCMGETNWIVAEDVPYVIQSIEIKTESCTLYFAGNYHEPLDPSQLWVGKDHILYCKVRGGKFSARFNRKPYLELAHYIDEDPQSGFYLKLGEKKYPIHVKKI